MDQLLISLMQSGESVGGYLLVWILWKMNQRISKLEDAKKEKSPA